MLIQEAWVNRTKDYRIGESDIYEPFTDNIKKLFKSLMKEYGRCTGKVRIDPDGKAIGWVFEKRTKYSDAKETFLQETWVTLHKEKPTVTSKYHYNFLKERST